MNNIIIEFIPILLLFLLATNTEIFVRFSQSILGKLAAIIIIIMYSTIDTIHGLFVCLIFILYYTSDYAENMLNREGLITSDNDSSSDNESTSKTTTDTATTATTAPAKTTTAPAKTTTATISKEETSKPSKTTQESFDTIEKAYGSSPSFNQNYQEAKELFKKQYCKNGHLIYKGQHVKPEMAQHIFPEIELNNERCNLCDSTCNFTIKEEKIRVEEELVKPKSSNDWFDYMKQVFA